MRLKGAILKNFSLSRLFGGLAPDAKITMEYDGRENIN